MKRNLMIQGTMSGAGKSLLVTALCRIFRQDGWSVAPFKSQNMALNSFVTADGKEMGRAQVLQAQAAGKAPDVRMNPILLKPSSDVGSQVIVNGEVRGDYRGRGLLQNEAAADPGYSGGLQQSGSGKRYHRYRGRGQSGGDQSESRRHRKHGPCKAGGCAGAAGGRHRSRAACLPSSMARWQLLEEDERQRIAGTIINKFRGDVSLLQPGLTMLEKLTGVPVLGVVPYTRVELDDEDSQAPRLQQSAGTGRIDIAVIRLPHISNFTDFAPLELHPELGVRYVAREEELGSPDLVILPGSKNTMGDLGWMRQNGLETAIRRLHGRGMPVLGICGGYQMLGETLSDPNGVEHGGTMNGMGLLPIHTVFSPEKIRTQTKATVCAFSDAAVQGYQIHMGRTDTGNLPPFCRLTDGTVDGAVQDGVFGTYLHGLFDSGELTTALADWLLERKGLDKSAVTLESHQDYQERQIDILADAVRQSLDMDAIYNIMEEYEHG